MDFCKSDLVEERSALGCRNVGHPILHDERPMSIPTSIDSAAYVPRHISGLLCRSSFCGRGRPVARGNGGSRFRRAHNV
jgi:hypothetical protein